MNKPIKSKQLAPLILAIMLISTSAVAAVVDSVLNDSSGTAPKLIILGNDLAGASFKLGGIDIPVSCISDISNTEQHIGYCDESALAVQGTGSYKLLINGATEFSIYFEQAILIPAPPPPPPLSDDCACVTGVSDNGSGLWSQPPIPNSNYVLCLWNETEQPYTDQVWISGSFDYSGSNYTFSALWDPNNPTYDPENPGNSTSVCALSNNTTGTYEVYHPVASDQQFKACFDWLIRKGGPCL